MQGVDLFITITDRSRAEQFAAWFRTHGISLVLTALGQGTATTEVLDFLGLEATEKAVLFCVSPRSPRLVRQAARDLWLDVPGQGVLMTVPVNSIGGSTAKEYLLHEQEGETAMEREIAHDLIVVIANQGSTDLVMDAAREAGATGGTVIHAKGTGTDLVRKFFRRVHRVGAGDGLHPGPERGEEAHYEGHHGQGGHPERRSVPGVLPAGG